MRSPCVRSGGKLFFCLLAIFWAAALVSSPPAARAAVVYDDFSGATIDSSKWTQAWWDGTQFLSGGAGQLSQHDGRLYYDSSLSNGQGAMISKGGIPGLYSVSAEFYNFASAISGGGWSGFGLTLGPSSNHAGIFLAQTPDGAMSFESGRYGFQGPLEAGNWVAAASNTSHAMLRADYVSGTVSLYYNLGTDPATGWERLWSVDPGWGVANELQIAFFGANGASGETHLQVDNVVFTASAVPVPPSLFLLAPGLVCLAAMRRRFMM